jgi:hypothetical protein
MKKYIVVVLLLLGFTATGIAQFRKIPADVTDAFRKKFPNAENVSWKDKLSAFQASFVMDEEEYMASFSSSGDWLETDRKSSFDDLPDNVVDGFQKSKYAEWETGDVYVIEKKDEDLTYRIFVKKNSLQKKYLFFNSDGELQRDALTL